MCKCLKCCENKDIKSSCGNAETAGTGSGGNWVRISQWVSGIITAPAHHLPWQVCSQGVEEGLELRHSDREYWGLTIGINAHSKFPHVQKIVLVQPFCPNFILEFLHLLCAQEHINFCKWKAKINVYCY